jgi:hypothetical protein
MMRNYINRRRAIAGYALLVFSFVLFIGWMRSYFEIVNTRITLLDRKLNAQSMRAELAFSSWPANGEEDWEWSRHDVPPSLFPNQRLSGMTAAPETWVVVMPYWLPVSVSSLVATALLWKRPKAVKSIPERI